MQENDIVDRNELGNTEPAHSMGNRKRPPYPDKMFTSSPAQSKNLSKDIAKGKLKL